MKFLVDNQLPAALARWFAAQPGCQGIHVLDLQLDSADDEIIWTYALANLCMLVSKDEDFATRAVFRQPAAPVVWVRLGNCRNQALLEAMNRALPTVIQRLEAGDALIEIC